MEQLNPAPGGRADDSPAVLNRAELKPGHGVLDRAFAVLDALCGSEAGLGLTELSRESGLAKASAYRLAEQLVDLGAVCRHDRRYYIGARLGLLGHRWHPDPPLRRAAWPWIHRLAVQSGAFVAVSVLVDGRPYLICSTAPPGHAGIPEPSPGSVRRTATGRVLLAARHPGATAGADGGPQGGQQHAVVDRQEVLPGVSCVAAPIWRPDGRCAGALTVRVRAPTPSPILRELVLRTARAIGADLI